MINPEDRRKWEALREQRENIAELEHRLGIITELCNNSGGENTAYQELMIAELRGLNIAVDKYEARWQALFQMRMPTSESDWKALAMEFDVPLDHCCEDVIEAAILGHRNRADPKWVRMPKADSKKNFGVSFAALKKRKGFRMKPIEGTRDVLIHPEEWKKRLQ